MGFGVGFNYVTDFGLQYHRLIWRGFRRDSYCFKTTINWPNLALNSESCEPNLTSDGFEELKDRNLSKGHAVKYVKNP
jgi:hypothetical protein